MITNKKIAKQLLKIARQIIANNQGQGFYTIQSSMSLQTFFKEILGYPGNLNFNLFNQYDNEAMPIAASINNRKLINSSKTLLGYKYDVNNVSNDDAINMVNYDEYYEVINNHRKTLFSLNNTSTPLKSKKYELKNEWYLTIKYQKEQYQIIRIDDKQTYIYKSDSTDSKSDSADSKSDLIEPQHILYLNSAQYKIGTHITIKHSDTTIVTCKGDIPFGNLGKFNNSDKNNKWQGVKPFEDINGNTINSCYDLSQMLLDLANYICCKLTNKKGFQNKTKQLIGSLNNFTTENNKIKIILNKFYEALEIVLKHDIFPHLSLDEYKQIFGEKFIRYQRIDLTKVDPTMIGLNADGALKILMGLRDTDFLEKKRDEKPYCDTYGLYYIVNPKYNEQLKNNNLAISVNLKDLKTINNVYGIINRYNNTINTRNKELKESLNDYYKAAWDKKQFLERLINQIINSSEAIKDFIQKYNPDYDKNKKEYKNIEVNAKAIETYNDEILESSNILFKKIEQFRDSSSKNYLKELIDENITQIGKKSGLIKELLKKRNNPIDSIQASTIENTDNVIAIPIYIKFAIVTEKNFDNTNFNVVSLCSFHISERSIGNNRSLFTENGVRLSQLTNVESIVQKQ